MGPFGERMRREREMRGVALEEIAEATKISTRFLRALEEENLKQLPGGIFNRGFVRAYAKFLGMDEELAVADWNAAERATEALLMPMATSSGKVIAMPAGVLANASQPELELGERERDPGRWVMAAAVAVVAILGVSGVVYKFVDARRSKASLSPAAAVVKAESHPAPVVAAPAAPATVSSSPAASPSSAAPGATRVPENAAAPEKTSVNTNTVKTAGAQELAAVETATAAPGKFLLNLRAREDSWVEVKADGKTILQSVIAAGSQRRFEAERELVVKVGNAAGVELAHNGHQLPQFATGMKTKTLTFTAGGLSESR